LSTYGRSPAVWFGLVTEIVRTVLARIVGLYIMSQIAATLAAGDAEAAKRYVLLFLVIYIAAACIGAIGEATAVRAENRIYGARIMDFYSKITGKDMAFYRDNQSGYLVSAFRQYVNGIMMLTRFIRTEFVRAAISLTVPALVLLYVDWRIGLVAIAVIVIQLFFVQWASSKVTPLRLASHEIYRKLSGEVADLITNILAFKSSGVEDKARTRVAELAGEETTTYTQRRITQIRLNLPRDVLTTSCVAIAFYVLASIASGPVAVGMTVLTLTYMFQIIRNVNDMPNIIEHHDNYVSEAYPALQYLDHMHEEVADPASPRPLHIKSGVIELDNVTFSYPGEAQTVPVFENLSITIKGGEQVGIVGLSGAGKSTLAGLLMRFDDVDSGAIRIDGVDIREVAQSELRRQIAYVPQEPLLFHRTIRDNIAYFDEDATQAQVERAARAAHAHEFISQLPQGYDSMVGERGVKLSGGQKQRVVIARAILKNAPIMLFDEATSALDTESERIIQQALPEIIGRHTAVVIAHRLSTIAGLDRILVMHDGKIEEEGTHAALLKAAGRYASLWRRQVEQEA
jgi:ATP-binding cassette subfamily B protein